MNMLHLHGLMQDAVKVDLELGELEDVHKLGAQLLDGVLQG